MHTSASVYKTWNKSLIILLDYSELPPLFEIDITLLRINYFEVKD